MSYARRSLVKVRHGLHKERLAHHQRAELGSTGVAAAAAAVGSREGGIVVGATVILVVVLAVLLAAVWRLALGAAARDSEWPLAVVASPDSLCVLCRLQHPYPTRFASSSW